MALTTACQNIPSSGQCRELRFTSAPIHGYWLKNHVIRTIRVSNEDICEWQCYLEPNCVSYNFGKKKEENGEHKCDLNNVTYEHDNEHAGDLVKNRYFVYRGAEVNIQSLTIVTIILLISFSNPLSCTQSAFCRKLQNFCQQKLCEVTTLHTCSTH